MVLENNFSSLPHLGMLASEISQAFGISQSQLFALHKANEIKRVRGVGRSYRYDLISIAKYYQMSGETQISDEIINYLHGPPPESELYNYVKEEDRKIVSRLNKLNKLQYQQPSKTSSSSYRQEIQHIHPAVILGILAALRKIKKDGTQSSTADNIILVARELSPDFYPAQSNEKFHEAIELLKFWGGKYKGGVISQERGAYRILSRPEQHPKTVTPEINKRLEERLKPSRDLQALVEMIKARSRQEPSSKTPQ